MEPPSITLERQALSDFERAIQKEWLVTNGLGGYASSTVLGLNTRKYHGLLVAPVRPPRDRRVFLAKLDEDLLYGNDIYRLGANEFEGSIFPRGFEFLREFSVSPFPKYTYVVDKVTVQKSVFMPREENCVVTIYNVSNRSNLDLKMRVFPLINWRHFHSITERKRASEPRQEQMGRGVEIGFQMPPATLMVKTTDWRYSETGKWVERLYLREEAHRGESCFDDCYQPGYFETSVRAEENRDSAIVVVAEEDEDLALDTLNKIPENVCDILALYKKETERHQDFIGGFHRSHPTIPAIDWLGWLVLATSSFIVRDVNDAQKSVIAGFHWFEAWGRDTFVSLPGLLLVTGRFEEARTIFVSYKKYCSRGLIPNLVPDRAGAPMYNTVDATLWYINAVLQYLKYTLDFDFVRRELWETLKTIIEEHSKGTSFNIRVDNDGLLSHGPQLTWVDSSVNGKPVTPRAGKAVEIQALWYNALKTMQILAYRFGNSGEQQKYAEMAEKTRNSFVDDFWNEGKGFLYDVIGEHERDSSLRPNQIIAGALDFPMLDTAKNESMVDVVQRELLTPYGLRTLHRSDPRYVGVYSGDRASRDKAYHNGTVWPWLLGPFTTSFLKVKENTKLQRNHAFNTFLKQLLTHQIYESGLGTLNEIFDGEPPYKARGCIA